MIDSFIRESTEHRIEGIEMGHGGENLDYVLLSVVMLKRPLKN